MINFIAYILYVILLGWNQGGCHGWDMWHAYYRGEVFTGCWFGGVYVRDHWEDLGEGGNITLRWNLGIYGLMGRAGLGYVRMGFICGLF